MKHPPAQITRPSKRIHLRPKHSFFGICRVSNNSRVFSAMYSKEPKPLFLALQSKGSCSKTQAPGYHSVRSFNRWRPGATHGKEGRAPGRATVYMNPRRTADPPNCNEVVEFCFQKHRNGKPGLDLRSTSRLLPRFDPINSRAYCSCLKHCVAQPSTDLFIEPSSLLSPAESLLTLLASTSDLSFLCSKEQDKAKIYIWALE